MRAPFSPSRLKRSPAQCFSPLGARGSCGLLWRGWVRLPVLAKTQAARFPESVACHRVEHSQHIECCSSSRCGIMASRRHFVRPRQE
jgi:hypothetical protein